MTWAPDAAHVINLARRPDRLAAFTANAVHLGFDYSVKTASDGRLLTPARWRSSPEAYSNACAHRDVLSAGSGTVAVFEDDALIPADFQDQMTLLLANVPKDWELLLLGGELDGVTGKLPGDVVRLTGFSRTFAYVVRHAAVAVAAHAAATANLHWDYLLSNLTCRRATAYAPATFMIATTGASSDIPDSRPMGARVGAGSGSRGVTPPLRLKQRDDGMGIKGHARLPLNNHPTSQQYNPAPRLQNANSYS